MHARDSKDGLSLRVIVNEGGLVVDVLERVKVMGSALAERRRRSLYGRPTEGHKAYSKISSGHV